MMEEEEKQSEKPLTQEVSTVAKSLDVVPVTDWRYPKRPKEGYRTMPDYDSMILKMTKEQLMRVEEFTIENKNGKIVFLGKTDLTDVDLASDVTIKARSVEVYPDLATAAPKGTKLNKAALVTLSGGVKPKNGSNLSAEEYETQLESMVESKGGVHLSYDSGTFTWLFKVPCFE